MPASSERQKLKSSASLVKETISSDSERTLGVESVCVFWPQPINKAVKPSIKRTYFTILIPKTELEPRRFGKCNWEGGNWELAQSSPQYHIVVGVKIHLRFIIYIGAGKVNFQPSQDELDF